MQITKQNAIDAINRGEARYDGITHDGGNDNGWWIITNHKYARTDHVAICEDDDAIINATTNGATNAANAN